MPEPEQPLPDAHRKEYAEFIALAVHELDAPLRKLSVLVDRLKMNTPEVDAGNGYFPRIQLCLDEMRSLINALAKLSGCAEAKQESIACDLGLLVEKIARDIPLLLQKGSLNISSLPVLVGDPYQYELLFRNLLENAVRFRKEETAPCVKIHASLLSAEQCRAFSLKQDRAYYEIIISDNGIGFRPQDATEIFKPFVRLNGKSDYPGNGIGLAICKKITDNHEGIIYAESVVNEGAQFILILPYSLN